MKLSEQLGVTRGLTALIGSGGKTTMLRVLATELCTQGTVILTTSTHILPFAALPCLVSPTAEQLRAALQAEPVVCVGSTAEAGKLTACELPFSALTSLADFVLVEADGSRGLPLKAHAGHEPVIPEATGLTVCLVGASGLDRPISRVVHRAELFCALSGSAPEDAATPEAVAAVLRQENLADVYYINQCELPGTAAGAAALAALLDRPAHCGSLRRYL